ncbi:hypothetical protein N1495_06245 [Streptococcus didelphis]|uniref:Uncharacterized protein n=1 Tax=Streptococcus didelphis TaxID=102886 RepID=A0ABY9LHS6_9STRE|nr:hypothetical protein [Streptococcus didelphis]WMB28386.1 hypothetical protein N1496_01820 [Streptococcus didelphis]WMB29071.1 hypothetical protein N1495_06245 [Streptococcus didelphis]
MLVELEASRQSQLKAMQDKFKVEVQEITNKERQRILLMKQEALKDLFDAALNRMKAFSKQEELAFMKKVFTNYQDQDIKVSLGEMTKEKLSQEDLAQLGELFPKLTFNPDTIAQEAGFIVSINQVDDTYLYSNLLGSIFKEESARISHVLFTES